jgi:hypothetical protein
MEAEDTVKADKDRYRRLWVEVDALEPVWTWYGLGPAKGPES